MNIHFMNRIRLTWKKKLKISAKFFLLFSIVSAVAVGSIALFFSLYFSRILVDREIASFKALTNSFLNQTENEIRIMDETSTNILYSGMVQDKFTHYLDVENGRNEIFSDLIDIFVAINGASFQLPMISVYSNAGEKVSMGAYSMRERVDISSLPWLPEVEEHGYRKYISEPYTSSAMQSSKTVTPYYMSLYRKMRSQQGDDIGYIETAQYAKDIFKSITSYEKLQSNDLRVLVFNEKGELIFPYENEGISPELQDYYYSLASQGENPEVFTNPFTGNREMLYGESSSYTGWTYLCIQDTQTVLAPVHTVSRILLLATLLILLFATLVSYHLSRSITRPIRDLLQKIDTTNLETLSGEKKHLDSSYNEFDELNDAFHEMSTNLKRSMDDLLHSRQREMESRFLTLQAQINPHFYYNSLSSIIALAEAGKNEEAVRFCRNLSQIMRYAAQRDLSTVSLETELSYAEKYLYCMKVRYQSSLSYSIDVDPDLYHIPVPRLIIQPLVENAIKHGTDCSPPWRITIEGKRTADGWRLRVCDSGKGFTAQSLRELDQKMERWNADASEYPVRKKEGGLGLINVYARWRIYCGELYHFSIENSEKGACIIIGQNRGEET